MMIAVSVQMVVLWDKPGQGGLNIIYTQETVIDDININN